METDRGLRLTGVVTDPDARPAAGTPVIVAVRPERLRVDAAAHAVSSGEGWTSIAGRIHQGTYLGDRKEFRIATDEAGEMTARRQNAAEAASIAGVGPGGPVVVRWEDSANLILMA